MNTTTNLAATVGVLGFIVTNLPSVPLGNVLVCKWCKRGFAMALTKGSLLEANSSTTSGLNASLFLSRKPSTEYQTCPAKCRIYKIKQKTLKKN